MYKLKPSVSVRCFGLKWIDQENGKYEILKDYDYVTRKLKDMVDNGFEAVELVTAGPWNNEEEKANAPAPKIEGLAEIGFDDFMKVELRVAEVKNCEPIKKAKKLLKLTLDDGTGTDRIVASGIAKWYKPEDLIGKKVIVVANLKPAVLCGVESCGMILAADITEEDAKVVFVDKDMPNGARIR